MAACVNKVILIGYLGSDPELRATPNGANVATFRVAMTKAWKDQSGQKQERTEWATCVAWRGTADIVGRFARKGAHVYVEGELQTRTWEDKNGGGKRYATEVLVDQFKLLDRMDSHPGDRENQRAMGSGSSAPDFSPSTQGPDDDLPF